MKVNLRIVYQLLAHVACLECDEPEFQDIKKAIMPYALMSHRAADLDLIASERGQLMALNTLWRELHKGGRSDV